MPEATERRTGAGSVAGIRVRTWPLHAGGFLGPFGGIMVTPMLPEVAAGLHRSVTATATAITAYLVPFAALMVVSGTLAERWGRRRTVRVAYVVYALASLACALAPALPWFVAGRAVQGTANAFTTPILMAALSDVVPVRRLGAALGLFGSIQAAGFSFAPLVGGAVATLDWRLAFAATATAALALALLPPPDAPRPPQIAPPPPDRAPGTIGTGPAGRPGRSWRDLLNPRLAMASAVAFSAYLTSSGIMLLGTLRAGDEFGLGPEARGLVVATFGAAGLATGWLAGRWLDRLGWLRFGVLAHTVLTATALLAGTADAVAVLALAIGLAGIAGTASRVVVNSLAVHSTPGNRAGASSIMLSWQFLGGALAPVVLLPVYLAHPDLGLPAAAGGAAVAVLLVLAAAGVQARRPGRSH